ncbi:hypothetical protein U750_10370 [Streptococcus pseudopneumoniae G42]|nr:hypothetical protein U750_10370 [Streptococcus pseudopneumoniae G42]
MNLFLIKNVVKKLSVFSRSFRGRKFYEEKELTQITIQDQKLTVEEQSG